MQAKRNTVLTFGGGVNEIQRELIATGRARAAPGAALTGTAADRRNSR